MSGFEFIFTLFGLLLGLALAEGLGSLSNAIKARHKVRIGWATALLGILVSCDIVTFWMYGWTLRDHVPVTWPFLFGGFIVTAIYFVAASLIFPHHPEEWTNLDDHFDANRRLVLGGVLICNIALFALTIKLSALPLLGLPIMLAFYALRHQLRLPGRPRDIQQVLVEQYRCDPDQLRVFGQEEWTAPPASGSARARAMVVCPCTTGALAAIANGNSDNLLERAADVTLKEGRKLILALRETPLSTIHLENMLRLARAGAVILPTSPGFYYRPTTAAELVDFIVARILDQLDIPHTLLPRWGEPPEPS